MLISALVHNAETHVFQHRHALREWQRPREAPHFQTDSALVLLKPMMEIDAERSLF